MAQEQLFADEYKVTLDVFEGPLDLLLYLIRREEIDIYDIPIEHIASEYMGFLKEARDLNLDIAGEFVVMAATLMVIKSRMLLPVDRRKANEDNAEEWVDPRLDLVRQLIEYKKFKDAAARLESMEALAANSFDYGGGRPKFEKTASDARGALANLDLYDLLSAFQDVLARASEVPRGELKGARFSVPERADGRAGLLRDPVRGGRAKGRDNSDFPGASRASAPAPRDSVPERGFPRDNYTAVARGAGRPTTSETGRL